MKILIIQLRQLGDILLTTPVVRAIKDQMPEADVDFMTYPMGKLIVPGNPLVRKHIVAPQDGVMAAMSFARKLRQEHYDVVLDFMATPRSAVMARLVPAYERIAFQTSRAPLFTQTIPRGRSEQYIVREKFQLLKPIGISSEDVRMTLPVDECDYHVPRSFINSTPELAESKLRVILSPTHRREERKWPLERWAQLAVWLERSRNAKVIWIWGPGEEEEINSVMRLSQGVGVKSPKTTFHELAALIAESHLFIGNSNGPSHVAVAMDTPSIQLHGPTSAVSWCPMTERHRAVQKASMSAISLSDIQQIT
ncbi:MAG: glycosyltransferase family 9 protein [bacterium]